MDESLKVAREERCGKVWYVDIGGGVCGGEMRKERGDVGEVLRETGAECMVGMREKYMRRSEDGVCKERMREECARRIRKECERVKWDGEKCVMENGGEGECDGGMKDEFVSVEG